MGRQHLMRSCGRTANPNRHRGKLLVRPNFKPYNARQRRIDTHSNVTRFATLVRHLVGSGLWRDGESYYRPAVSRTGVWHTHTANATTLPFLQVEAHKLHFRRPCNSIFNTPVTSISRRLCMSSLCRKMWRGVGYRSGTICQETFVLADSLDGWPRSRRS